MTTKQRNFWLAALALAAIIYLGPRFLASRPAEKPAPPEVKTRRVEAPAPPDKAPGVEAFNNLLGIWQGTAPLPAGMCGLKFELRKKADDRLRDGHSLGPSHDQHSFLVAAIARMGDAPLPD